MLDFISVYNLPCVALYLRTSRHQGGEKTNGWREKP